MSQRMLIMANRKYLSDLQGAARMAFEGPAAAAVLISQRALGAKTFGR